MYFKEKDEESVKNTVASLEENEVDISSENHKTIYGITDLSNDMTDILKKVAFTYKSTLEFRGSIKKKNDIVKGAVTQNDIQSMIKIISHDIDSYMQKMHVITNRLRKAYLQLESKINIILVSTEMDDKYQSVFNKTFFYKALNIAMDRHSHETVNSGICLIKLSGLENKPDIFIKNTYSAMLQKIYPELRYLDVVARVSDDLFAVLIVDVSRDNFTFMLKQIMQKTKPESFKQSVSAGMIDQFDNNDSLVKTLESNLAKLRNLKDDIIFV